MQRPRGTGLLACCRTAERPGRPGVASGGEEAMTGAWGFDGHRCGPLQELQFSLRENQGGLEGSEPPSAPP